MDKIKIRKMLGGVKSYLPNGSVVLPTYGTDSARYCYTVWLRHLKFLKKNGLVEYPEIIAELGPGDSIGTGLAGLIAGGKKYYALDVIERANIERNISVFDELCDLFDKKTNLPNDLEFPDMNPKLIDDVFPEEIIIKQQKDINKEKILDIKKEIKSEKGREMIKYFCPWYDPKVIRNGIVDLVFSQAVLEHVNNLPNVYKAMYEWVKKDGMVSHSIDFQSHGLSKEWNGHWSFSDLTWKIIRGNRPYLINREPLSSHIKAMKDVGFEILDVVRITDYSKKNYTGSIKREKLASRFKELSSEDFATTSAYICAKK